METYSRAVLGSSRAQTAATPCRSTTTYERYVVVSATLVRSLFGHENKPFSVRPVLETRSWKKWNMEQTHTSGAHAPLIDRP